MIWQKLMTAAGSEAGLSTRWRMNITALSGTSAAVFLYELELRGASGGADLTSPGDASTRASASTINSASYDAEKAFDDDNGTRWISDTWAGGPEWIEWEFADAVTIVEIGWLAQATNNSPEDFDIQYYDADLASWQTYWSETGKAESGSLQISTYPG